MRCARRVDSDPNQKRLRSGRPRRLVPRDRAVISIIEKANTLAPIIGLIEINRQNAGAISGKFIITLGLRSRPSPRPIIGAFGGVRCSHPTSRGEVKCEHHEANALSAHSAMPKRKPLEFIRINPAKTPTAINARIATALSGVSMITGLATALGNVTRGAKKYRAGWFCLASMASLRLRAERWCGYRPSAHQSAS